jgi:glycosyltransferase involved in cell wall biosynthesis
MHISVVIPTYNRAQNLSLVLTSLAVQTNRNFSVVVADDGSDDDTANVVECFQSLLSIDYAWQPHDGYRVSMARNMGVVKAKEVFNPSHIWFLDSDVLLNPQAFEHMYWLLPRLPADVVVCGRYDWMPPMPLTVQDVRYGWQSILERWASFAGLMLAGYEHLIDSSVPRYKEVPYVGGNRGIDPRAPKQGWFNCTSVQQARGVTLSGNLVVPVPIFDASGGFDESIKDQGQDGEFSYNLWSKNYRAVMCGHAYGLHIYHPRDPDKLLASARRTIKYIHEKYDVPLEDVPSDWHKQDLTGCKYE